MMSAPPWVFAVALGVVACAPEARHVPCASDAECRAEEGELEYCLQHRCVECLGESMCHGLESCVDGRCIER
jgi:hypothetical protein